MGVGICFECGENGEIDKHHVVPRSLGGTKTIPLCLKCHGLVHGKDLLNMRNLQKSGIEKAIKEGKYTGRVKGSSDKVSDYLELKITKDIIECLNDGLSLRQTTRKVNSSLGTVQKVKKLYNGNLTSEERKMTVRELLEIRNSVK
jgi:hypothetical protein